MLRYYAWRFFCKDTGDELSHWFWQENVIFLTNQKRPFYEHARGVGRHLEIKFASKIILPYTLGEANFRFRTKWLEVFLEKSFSLEAFPLKWTKKLCEMCFPVSGILKKVCLYDHHEIHTRTYERCHWSQLSISKYNSALVYSSLCIVGENDKFLKSRMPSHYIFLFSSSKILINSFAAKLYGLFLNISYLWHNIWKESLSPRRARDGCKKIGNA